MNSNDDIVKFIIQNKNTLGEFHMDALFQVLNTVEYVIHNNIEGDFVEIGVFKGLMVVAILAKLNQLKVTNRLVHLYDTFSGMTEPCDRDIDAYGNNAKTILEEIKCFSPVQHVQNNVDMIDYPKENIIYHIGDILNETYENVPKKISFLRLDTDWYESTKYELELFEKNVSFKGIITSDDYNWWKGCTQAVNEYNYGKNINLNHMNPHGAWWVKNV